MKLSGRHKFWLYGSFSVLLLTGVAWLFRNIPGLLQMHGAAAMLFLIVFGSLIPTHILKGFRIRRNISRHKLWSGNALTGAIVFLIVTGYALYYAGGERVRWTASFLHTLIGCGSAGLLLWHLLSRKRKHRHSSIHAR